VADLTPDRDFRLWPRQGGWTQDRRDDHASRARLALQGGWV